MKVRARYDHWLPKLLKVGAITLYPFVLFACPRYPSGLAMSYAKHEVVHVRQVRALGWWFFYTTYVLQWARSILAGKDHNGAYMAITYEREAYEQEQRNVLTTEEAAEFGL